MFKEIFERIKSFDTIVIFGHINPDGDCYGSQIALRNTLRLKFPEKKIYALGSGLKRFYQRLGKLDDVSDETIESALAIIVDGNDLPRMEDSRVFKAKAFAKFDHHLDTGTFTEGPAATYENASSCCEIIFDFIKEYNLPLDKNIAEALYLGIMTDTGRFQYANDHSKALRQAAELVDLGAEPDELNRILNLSYETSMLFKGYVFTHYKKTDKGVIYLSLDQPTITSFGLNAHRAGNMVNLLANIQFYPIWAFFCENEDGSMHAEFRSNNVPVQPVAARHGGGGHKCAAGVTMPKYNEETVQMFLNEFDELLSQGE